MSSLSQKDESIRVLVQLLRDRFGTGSFTVLDNWMDDPFAIGIANARGSGVLAYISTRSDKPRDYFISFELPASETWVDHPYTPAGEVSVESFDALVELLEARVIGGAT